MTRRALVAQTRVPEVDRDSGSQQVNLYIQWLRERGWSVAFVATDTDGEAHHAHRLRQLGVPTYLGYDEAKELLSVERIDLAVLAFWKPASQLLPLIRATSPQARVIVDSVDVHFLREARRALGSGARLDDDYGTRLTRELNTYRDADTVITPSPHEVDVLANFLEGTRIHDLPLAKTVKRSELPFEERRGMFFAGNFRHLPNGEAVEYLCREILPLLDPAILRENRLTVVGSRLDDKVRAHGRGLSAVQMVGWVPSIEPYLERARVCVAPLLHGAGIKGKIVEAMLRGTPVVTTPIGAEGLDLWSGEHAMVAEDPAELATAITEVLSSKDLWQRLSDAAYELASARHSPDNVGVRFHEIVHEVLAAEPQVAGVPRWRRRTGRRELAYRAMTDAVTETLGRATEAGSTTLVVSRGDDALTAGAGRRTAHFPRNADGEWAGNHPADSDDAIRQLEAEREKGARYLAVPASSFWWLHHYDGLAEHLEGRYRRIHANEHLVLFDLDDPVRAESPGTTPDEQSVLVIGACEHADGESYARIVAELDRSTRCEVTHAWNEVGSDPEPSGMLPLPPRAEPEFDWTLFISDGVTLPRHFLDDLIRLGSVLTHSGVERLQPAHAGPPEAGPPVTQRLGGVLGREVEAMTPVPVLAVRGGASTSGPVVLVDACPVELRKPLSDDDGNAYSDVWDVFGARFGARRAVERSGHTGEPLISVLVATHARPELLRTCLAGFCEQTLPVAEFEVVVVDDGSPGDDVDDVLREFAPRLPLTWTRIEHSGRSAAKNLAVMLARGEIVLFFDDDDAPAPDLLEQHLRAHELNPEETTAILGHTEWAPQLEVSPLMHYLTDVDKLLFSYGNLKPGERRNWQAFWEGRVSAKRSLLLRHGLHDQRLDYSIDVELAWRLARLGLEVVYEPAARSFMARAVDFEAFCRRCEDKGRAGAAIAKLHPDEEIVHYLKVDGAEERWREAEVGLKALVARVRGLESAPDARDAREGRLKELHQAYRAAFQAYTAKGLAEGAGGELEATRPAGAAAGNGRPALASVPAPTPVPITDDGGGDGANPPVLTVTMPVWNRSEELAEMATRTIDRVWQVSRMPTEVVVVDNGSPLQREMPARVHRFERNHGVATGWNTGIALARASVIAVLNSDCLVEQGWDEALYEAVTTGRRIAFPYTDHCDGRGFRRPDQAGTSGWCFMLSRATFEEVGPFDERFNPAYGEDNDYWHRAWELGVELTPVPDAHVTHPRRMSADGRADALLVGHRYLYGWKHGIDPMRPPPYFERKIVEYETVR